MNLGDATKRIKKAAEDLASKVKSIFALVKEITDKEGGGGAVFGSLAATFERVVQSLADALVNIDPSDVETLDRVRKEADRVRACVDSISGLLGRWQGEPFGGAAFAGTIKAVQLAVDALDDMVDELDDAAKAPTKSKAKPSSPAPAS